MKKDRKIKFNFKTLVLIVFTLFISANIFYAINLSSNGVKLSLIEEEINKIEEENSLLSRVLAEKTSLKKLENLAQEKGFEKSSSVMYIKEEESVAQLTN